MKPHLACDADITQINGLVWVMPKLDGVRSLHINDEFVGRSLKPHANKNLDFSNEVFKNLDGELTVGSVTDGATCRRTTSAVRRIDGPDTSVFHWHLFDSFEDTTERYFQRYDNLCRRVAAMHAAGISNVSLVPFVPCFTADEVVTEHVRLVSLGYEGSILRDPFGMYKEGRATVIEGAFLRIKDFVEEEFLITGLEEGEANNNVAQTNELGKTFRSSHKANKVPNGMVGALLGIDLKTNLPIRVSAGRMTHDERRFYFENPSEILGQIGKYRTMPYGKKDAPRFPTFVGLRAASDVDPSLSK